MTDKPSEQDDKEAERRFNETLGRMLGTPPKPHKEKGGREPEPALEKDASMRDSPEYQAQLAAILAGQSATAEPRRPSAST